MLPQCALKSTWPMSLAPNARWQRCANWKPGIGMWKWSDPSDIPHQAGKGILGLKIQQPQAGSPRQYPRVSRAQLEHSHTLFPSFAKPTLSTRAVSTSGLTTYQLLDHKMQYWHSQRTETKSATHPAVAGLLLSPSLEHLDALMQSGAEGMRVSDP